MISPFLLLVLAAFSFLCLNIITGRQTGLYDFLWMIISTISIVIFGSTWETLYAVVIGRLVSGATLKMMCSYEGPPDEGMMA